MKELLKKIARVSKAAVLKKDGAIKDRNNKFLYSIRTEEGILGFFRPMLRDENLHIWIDTIDSVFANATSVKVIVHCKIMDLDTGETLSFCAGGSGLDKGDKDFGKAVTYGFRNAIQKLFLLVSEEDSESTSSEQNIEDLHTEIKTLMQSLWSEGAFSLPSDKGEEAVGRWNAKNDFIKEAGNNLESLNKILSSLRSKMSQYQTSK